METQNNIKKRIKYNNDLLVYLMERDKFNPITIVNEDLTRNTIIEYKCSCGIVESKMFRYINEHGGYCNICLKKRYTNKVKETNIKRFGKEYASQNIEIKERVKQTIKERYNVDYALQSPDIKEKIKITNINKYGVDNPSKSEIVKCKIKNTYISKYGVNNIMELDEIKNKIKQTNMIKYGVEHSIRSDIVLEKSRATCIEKYGVTSPMMNQEIVNKTKKTNIEKYGVTCTLHTSENRKKIKELWINKYGVEYPMQNIDIQEKSQNNSKKFKEYKMPSGNIRMIQGYEHFALDELIRKYSEEDILTNRKDVGRIMYTYENKIRYYFPDIKIISKNKFIEVKSTWTYNIDKDMIITKMNACKEQGFNYEIWVYDDKGKKETIQ